MHVQHAIASPPSAHCPQWTSIRGRFAEAPEARYGLVASSRDKILQEWGIPNDYQSTNVMRLGP